MTTDVLALNIAGPSSWITVLRRVIELVDSDMSRPDKSALDGVLIQEKAIIRRIKSGSHDTMSELVRLHSDRLFQIIRRLVLSDSVSQDVLQETWVRIVRRFYQFDESRPFGPWAAAIAVNCCRDYQRRERFRNLFRFRPRESRSEEMSTGDFDFVQLLPADSNESVTTDVSLDLDAALAKLNPRLRNVVVLKFYGGLTQTEIAESLAIPQGTVKSRLHQALKLLRNSLGPRGKELAS